MMFIRKTRSYIYTAYVYVTGNEATEPPTATSDIMLSLNVSVKHRYVAHIICLSADSHIRSCRGRGGVITAKRRTQLESHRWIFSRTAGDISICVCCSKSSVDISGGFCGEQNRLVFSQTISIHDCGEQNREFKLSQDVF